MNSMSLVSSAKQRSGGCGGGEIPKSSSPLLALVASSISRCFFTVTTVVVVGLIAVVLFQNNTYNNNNDPILSSLPRATTTTTTASFRKADDALEQPNNAIVQGLWGSEAYYHCPANINNNMSATNVNNNMSTTKQVQDIVLWHGSSFTKEEWKTKGILEKLCSVDHFSVTALDLSHRSNHQALVELLHGLQNEQKILTLPVAAIVTPSASGFGIVDWINQDTVDFVQSVQLWVPVACGSVTDLDPSKMKELKNVYEFPVLAIHGNEDSSGRRQSNFLAEEMGAEVVELQGGHPCYLQSPDAFVETLTKKLESLEEAT